MLRVRDHDSWGDGIASRRQHNKPRPGPLQQKLSYVPR
jgi:hypothetical protein